MRYDLDTVAASLCFTYQTIVASEPLLRFALTRCDGDLKAYYEKHLAEETGHDAMLLDDLKLMGVNQIPRSHVAAQLAGSQYYLLAHDHPALLLGYMHALERNSMSVESVDELSRELGVELRCLRHHAAHDPGHKSDLEAMIAGLDPELRKLVEWNEQCVIGLIEKAMA